jgi:cytochrome c oxidase assembly factor 1
LLKLTLQWAVKRDPIARELLGEHITYRDYWPWVTGEINQIKGNIQFSYAVKGDKQAGTVHFHCIRRTRNSQDWQILDWRLVADDGTDVALTPDKVEPAA